MLECDIWHWSVCVLGLLAVVAILLKRPFRIHFGQFELVMAEHDEKPGDTMPPLKEENKRNAQGLPPNSSV
jgi:hypothetical protein